MSVCLFAVLLAVSVFVGMSFHKKKKTGSYNLMGNKDEDSEESSSSSYGDSTEDSSEEIEYSRGKIEKGKHGKHKHGHHNAGKNIYIIGYCSWLLFYCSYCFYYIFAIVIGYCSIVNNKGRFCNNCKIDTLISKWLSVEKKAKLSQLETQNTSSTVLFIFNFQLREFYFLEGQLCQFCYCYKICPC